METRNGNIGNGKGNGNGNGTKMHQSLVQCFLHGRVLSRVLLSNGDMTGFALP